MYMPEYYEEIDKQQQARWNDMTGRLEELTKDQVVEYENGGSGAGVEAPF